MKQIFIEIRLITAMITIYEKLYGAIPQTIRMETLLDFAVKYAQEELAPNELRSSEEQLSQQTKSGNGDKPVDQLMAARAIRGRLKELYDNIKKDIVVYPKTSPEWWKMQIMLRIQDQVFKAFVLAASVAEESQRIELNKDVPERDTFQTTDGPSAPTEDVVMSDAKGSASDEAAAKEHGEEIPFVPEVYGKDGQFYFDCALKPEDERGSHGPFPTQAKAQQVMDNYRRSGILHTGVVKSKEE